MMSLDMREITGGFSCWTDGEFSSLAVSPEYGHGEMSRVVSFKRGLSIIIQDFVLYGDGEIRLISKTIPVIGFFTYFSGIRHITHTRPRMPLGHGSSYIELPGHNAALSMKVKSRTPIKMLSVCIDHDAFLSLTGKSCDQLADDLDFLDANAGKKENRAGTGYLACAQKACGYQAWTSLSDTPCDTLFLEAKALEMVALQLRQIDHLIGKKPSMQKVDHYTEKVVYACEILKKEMADPPRARQLARRVGLNHNQLVQGFKQMFGLCPFEYLRAIRLEKAYDLIAGRQCNVTEAVFNVGYASLSSFTKSFQKEFGLTPNELARAGKK